MEPTYLELIRQGALAYTDRTAIVFGDRQMSFAQVDALSSQLAHAFGKLGAAPGTRVALLVNNGLYSVPIDFSCVKAGVNRVPLNARLSLDEHIRMLGDAGCTMLVFGADLAERAAALQATIPALQCHGLGATAGSGVDLLALAEQQPVSGPDIQVRPDDVVITLYTSGTTGTLKAAQHTQASYAGICRNVLLNLIAVTPDDVMLHAASLVHASGVFVLPFWLRGARTVILPGFEPAAYLRALTEHRVTAINLVPTMLQMLLDAPTFAATDVSALRQVIYGASPMPRAVIQKAMQHWGQHRFWQYYGQTEVPLCLAVLRPEEHTEELLGACGRPALDVELRLLDSDGKEAAPGTPGEIVVRAPSAVAGYYNAPELNAATFSADGWVHTRDIGVFDSRGYLHIKDRTSDMIITGGYNVYPREVEDALSLHPAVQECAVVGTPDDKWVEVVTAVVVLRAGQSAGEAELAEWVAARLASYKKPKRILFAADIPKTAVGKLNRKQLRDRLKE
ncbi:class I adenylate-forming enzyme family protein [Undibacterium sp.]|uniref:class I adenylate-forming enzyme family protein n=1 Tax=Undibacterium sp. TaxID=1914977 RepID=UPI002D161D85|nr:AMP-binding protein [Undibacterium sp.]HTD04005.1 AMP-binding protein [Undibacterium sp.]